MTTTTPHGQVPAIQRYKIGYHSDEWGVRSSTPGGICDDAGPWVRYEDHVTALKAAQPVVTPQQGAADLPEALRLADIADDGSWAFVIGVRKDIAVELRRLHALAAGQAAQQGAAYAALPDVDALVQEIRRVDGAHKLGAGALAEALMPFLRAFYGQASADAKALAEADRRAVRAPADSVQEDAVWYRWLRDTSNADDHSHMISLQIRDAAYLIGRLREGSMPYARAIEIICERIDAAKAAIRARAAQGDALESEYRRGYRHGYEQRDAEVRGALA